MGLLSLLRRFGLMCLKIEDSPVLGVYLGLLGFGKGSLQIYTEYGIVYL